MRNLDAQLNESLRDACVSYYLGQITPNTPSLSAVRTEGDLYEYLLLDPKVATDVSTSRVALAIASIQQYLNGLALSMEPGRTPLPADDAADWVQSGSQYAIWAADQELQDYPENYIDPTLRKNRTRLFDLLESMLAARKLDDTAIQRAFLAYLAGFEAVSNLKVVNGYADAPDTANAVYYLIGQSNLVPNQFYWRSLDMSQRDSSGALNPTAWTEWQRIELAQSADIEIIRPFVSGGRLHLVWLQRGELPQTGPDQDASAGSEYKLCCAYRGFDGDWSVPHTLDSWTQLTPEGSTDPADASTFDYDLIAIVDRRPDKYNGTSYSYYNGEDTLYFSLSATDGTSNFVYRNVACDLMFVPLGAPAVPSGATEQSLGQYLHLNFYKEDSTLQSAFGDLPAKQDVDPQAGSGDSAHQNAMSLKVHAEQSSDGKQVTFTLEGLDGFVEAGTTGTLQLTQDDTDYTVIGSAAVTLDGNASTGPFTVPAVTLTNNSATQKYYLVFLADIDPPLNAPSVTFTVTYTGTVLPDKNTLPALAINTANNAQYLDFSGVTDTSMQSLKIRLNTQIGKDLIARASASVASVLSWDTQTLTEPPLDSSGAGTPLDFNGANGLYFWELFFHAPHLVAYRLHQAHQYAQATQWMHYLFDPSARRESGSSPPAYWNCRPLVEAGHAAFEQAGPTDPDAIAYSNPIHYQKAVFGLYVRNLIAAGDALYRTLTPDSLSQAKLIYRQALDLLGPFPGGMLEDDWAPTSLGNAVAAGNPALDAVAAAPAGPTPGPGPVPQGRPPLGSLDQPFRLPVNRQLLTHWTTLDSRLYNLRHNLSLTGQPISVPLYATPADPARLMTARGAGATPLQVLGYATTPVIPSYRFQALLPTAYHATTTLQRFGDLLLSYQERQDRAEQETLQQAQLLALSDFTIRLQQQAQQASQATLTVLNDSLDAARNQQAHYQSLIDNGISAEEQAAIDLQTEATRLNSSSIPFLGTAAALAMLPNIKGMAWGGRAIYALTGTTGTILQISSIVKQSQGMTEVTSASYDRRREDWEFLLDQSTSEVQNLTDQIAAQDILAQSALIALSQAQAQQQQILDMQQFLATRSSNTRLYLWLAGQMSALYGSAYQAVQALCLATQASWQYEMGDFHSTFIDPNAWNDSYRGLTAGDVLTLNLQQMENAYLQRNERRLEIVRTVALSTLIGSDWKSRMTTDAAAHTSCIDITLGESLFDNDYPGHYQRQLKSINLTLPATVGPYQDVRATLSQTSSSVLLTADITGVRYLLDNTKGNATHVMTNLRPSQQIVLSSGLNDAGQFMLDMNDQRYLPFEGTGAVSTWRLTFPQADSAEQSNLLASLSDIIVQLRYTARDGGPVFAKAVIAELTSAAGQ